MPARTIFENCFKNQTFLRFFPQFTPVVTIKQTGIIKPLGKKCDRKEELKVAGKLKREKVSWVAFIDLSVCAGDQQALADGLHFLLAAIVRMFFRC